MQWTRDDGERDWHRWFAWYPVPLRNPQDYLTPQMAWLEYVERRTLNLKGYLIRQHRALVVPSSSPKELNHD